MKKIAHPIRINRADEKIEVSKPFLKRADLFGTEESRMLEEVRAAYPTYTVIGRSIKTSETERWHNKVTYAYMERYIQCHENWEERMKEYKEMRLRSECHSSPFSKVKSWFVKAYPNIDDFTPDDFLKEQEKASPAPRAA